MRKHTMIALLGATLTSCAVSAEGPNGLRVALEGFKTPRPERYLVGETISARAVVENTGTEAVRLVWPPLADLNMADMPWKLLVKGDQVGAECPHTLVERKPPFAVTFSPGARIAEVVKPQHNLGPGKYEMWLEYDVSPGLEWFLEKEGIPRFRLESNHFRFEIVQPQGEDAQVLEEFGHHISCNELQTSGATRAKIIEEFPTSTYAGLLRVGPGGSNELPEPFSLPSPGDRGYQESKEFAERSNAGRAIRYAAAIDILNRYLAARPDFDGADLMRFRIAWYHDYLGELDKARRLLDGLLAKEDLPPWLRSECNRLLEHVEQKAKAR